MSTRAHSAEPLGGNRSNPWGVEPGQYVPAAAHTPCMLNEVLDNLFPASLRRSDGKYDGTYVDCTFGRGGHSKGILDKLGPDSRLFAFDVDPTAVREARKLEAQDSRFHIIHRPFGDLDQEFEPGQVNGVLADLGVSSPQLDEANRGFATKGSAPLDMRMNQDSGISASQWLQRVSQEELAWVIHNLGEDGDSLLSQRIAATILEKQKETPRQAIALCKQLEDIVKSVKEGINEYPGNPSKLTMQAIRMFLNREMDQLDSVFNGAMKVLTFGGKLCIISFKKTEANAIRRHVREHEIPDDYLRNHLSDDRLCELFPLVATDKDFVVQQVTVQKVTDAEIERNFRSRSSAIHVLQKNRRDFPVLKLSGPLRPISERLKEPEYPPFAGGPVDGRSSASRRATEPSAAANDTTASAAAADTQTTPSCAAATAGNIRFDGMSSSQASQSKPGCTYPNTGEADQARESAFNDNRAEIPTGDRGQSGMPKPAALPLLNAAPDRDAHPVAGTDAALGSCFNTGGAPNHQQSPEPSVVHHRPAPPNRPSPPSAPDGWSVHWNVDHSQYFFYNIARGESQWEPP